MKNVYLNKNLVIIGFAELISGFGNWITMIALYAILIFDGKGSVFESSAIFLAGLVPALFLSPIAGVVADRYDRKILMIISQLLSGLVISGIFFTRNTFLIYLLVGLQSITYSLMTPARQAAVPDLIDKENLSKANAFLQQVTGITKVFSPIIAGFVLSIVSPNQAILFDVLSFFLSAIILSFLPSLPGRRTVFREKKLANSKHFEFLKNITSDREKMNPQVKTLFSLNYVIIFVLIGFDVLTPIYIRDYFMGDEKMYGFLIGLIGIGTLISSVFVMLRKHKKGYWLDITRGIGFLMIIPVVFVVAVDLSNVGFAKNLMYIACLLGGIGNGFLVIQVITLLQVLTPERIMGKMSGFFQAVTIAGQLSGLILIPIVIPRLLNYQTFFILMAIILGLLFFVSLYYTKRNNQKEKFIPQFTHTS